MSKPLFSEFEPVSAKAWKQKIQVDLKGADYNNTLIWNSNEGIPVKPFYHLDDFNVPPYPSNTKASKWKIGQYIVVSNSKLANNLALKAIEGGVENLLFGITNKDVDLHILLKNVNLKQVSVDFYVPFLSEHFMESWNNYTDKNMISKYYHTDIIGNLAKTGNWFTNLKEDHNLYLKLVKQTHQLSINAGLYQNAGANMVQQLAYALAHANEYLNFIDQNLSTQYKKNLEVTFNTAIGSNYFFEIAKLRALRQLWSSLAKTYELNLNCRIISSPSKRNKTIYNYNVNMLRSTTECMSAVLGGANVIFNMPYDALFNKPNSFGNRISKNQLLILKHESHFNKVDNPADGSYYIETLTKELAQKALDLFKDIEHNGGFLFQLKQGTIQRKIRESVHKEQTDFNNETRVLVGINKYQNYDDKMKNNMEINPFPKLRKRKTIIEPIIEKRLSEQLEINRLKNE